MKTKIIRTTNLEVYKGIKSLGVFSNSVFLEGITEKQINKILKNINSEKQIIKSEIVNNGIIIKKVNDFNFEIYLG